MYESRTIQTTHPERVDAIGLQIYNTLLPKSCVRHCCHISLHSTRSEIKFTKVRYFSNVCCHAKFRYPALSDPGVATTRHVLPDTKVSYNVMI
jgi:hypothetical protein